MLRITTLRQGAGRPAQLRLAGPNGVAIHIDLTDLKLSEVQYQALSALFANRGDITRLSEEERDALSQANAHIGSSAEGPICRFDLKCVKINKVVDLNWEEIHEATLVEEVATFGQ